MNRKDADSFRFYSLDFTTECRIKQRTHVRVSDGLPPGLLIIYCSIFFIFFFTLRVWKASKQKKTPNIYDVFEILTIEY